MQQTILIVDDAPQNIGMITVLFKNDYRVRVANGGERALLLARQPETRPDLILLDIEMPGLDGYETCRLLKADSSTATIPVIFLTAHADLDEEVRGFEQGAVDYIRKPISPPILMSRVRAHLALKTSADFLKDKNGYLEQEIARRICEMQAIQDVTIIAMASLAETRDNETGNHIRRTQLYVQTLAERLADHPRFSAFLNQRYIDTLVKSAPLHDIGKVGIPDRILLKPGRLTPEEFAIMKSHTTLGRDAIERSERALGTRLEFLACAKEIAYSHHERWDGSGYPLGLIGEAIPLSARLMAVADVYDALISRRVYKEAMPHDEAMAILRKEAGSHFDPDLIDAFHSVAGEIRQIAAGHADGPELTG